jgi:hypothetical protein
VAGGAADFGRRDSRHGRLPQIALGAQGPRQARRRARHLFLPAVRIANPLLKIYSKSEKTDLTPAEINQLKRKI